MSTRFSLRWWAARLSLSAAAFALSLGVIEVALRLLGYEAAAAVASEPTLFWRHDPLLGWSNAPGVSDVFVGPRPYPIEFRTPVSIDRDGLRGPELEPLPEGGLRVLLLGDSLVASFEVKYEESFAALVQKRLARALDRPVQVLNAGVRGWGTDQSLLYFRERGRKLAPQLVVYMQSYNDPDDNMTLHRMRRPFGKPAFSLRPDGSLEPVGTPVPDYPACSSFGLDADYTPVRLDGLGGRAFCLLQLHVADHSALFTFAVQQVARSPRLLNLIRRVAAPGTLAAAGAAQPQLAGFGPLATPSARDPERRAEAGHRLTGALIRQLAKEVRESGASFVWIAAPDQVAQLDAAALAADGVVPTYLQPRATPDLPIYFRNDSHLNWRGHEMIAPLITQVLLGPAQARFADESCELHATAPVAFSSPEPSDRIEVQASGSPCREGSLALRVLDARGRELYRFDAPIERLLPRKRDLPREVERLAERMTRQASVRWSQLPDVDHLPPDGTLTLEVPKPLFQKFREQQRPVILHAAEHQGWQALVFDGKRAVVILRAGL